MRQLAGNLRSPDGKGGAAGAFLANQIVPFFHTPLNVAKQGADPEMKWCLTFADIDKPLVLNATNIQLCEKVFRSDDTDDWHGVKVRLYVYFLLGKTNDVRCVDLV